MGAIYDKYLRRQGHRDYSGNPVSEQERRENAAIKMYRDLRISGHTPTTAYIVMVKEAGAELADMVRLGDFPPPASSQDPRMCGETWKEYAEREAGISHKGVCGNLIQPKK